MRKLIYLFLTVLIVACSGDGDQIASMQDNNLIGKWEPVEGNYIPEGTTIDSNVELYPINFPCEDSIGYLEFDDNSSGVNVSFDNNCVQENYFFVWSLTGDFLLFTDDINEIIEEYELISVTATSLILKGPREKIDDNVFGYGVFRYIKIEN